MHVNDSLAPLQCIRLRGTYVRDSLLAGLNIVFYQSLRAREPI